MKLLNKLALVAAMSVSANAMALQSMDDEALSATTGQDGITLQVFTQGITIEKLFLHDNDGLATGKTIRSFDSRNKTATELAATPQFVSAYNASIATAADPANPTATEVAAAQQAGVTAAAGAGVATVLETNAASPLGGSQTAGALIIEDVSITKNSSSAATKAFATITIDTDGGSTAAADSSEAFLNVGVALSAMDIAVGKISVGKSNAALALATHNGARRGVNDLASASEILSGLTLSLGEADLNIQLGAQPQGAMIIVDSQINGGVLISDLIITDSNGATSPSTYQTGVLQAIGGAPGQAGKIKIDGLKITSAGESFLDANVKINVDKNLGLAVSLSNTKMDIYTQGIRLGETTSASIGDLEIQGINMGGSTLFVKGH